MNRRINLNNGFPLQQTPFYATQNKPDISLGNSFTPVKGGTTKSHLVFIIDESSSMHPYRAATIDGINEFIDSQRKKTKVKTFVSVYTFNGDFVGCVVNRKNIKHFEKFTEDMYSPSGMTNLNDAIGGTMININNSLKVQKKKKRDSVIFNIMTDGAENASKVFNKETIKIMVDKAQEMNWGFNFFGANIDAFSVGGGLGFAYDNTIQYDTVKSDVTFRSAARKTSDMIDMYSQGMTSDDVTLNTAFTTAERSVVVGNDNGK